MATACIGAYDITFMIRKKSMVDILSVERSYEVNYPSVHHLIENSCGKKFFIGQFIVKMYLCALHCTPLTLGLSKINALSNLTFANLYALLTAFQIILPLSFVEVLF